MTAIRISVPEATREKITAAVSKYAAAHGRSIDDELLHAMAADVLEVSGFVSKRLAEDSAAEYTRIFTKFTRDILRDLVRHGHCITESVLVTGKRAFYIDHATNEEWEKFAALCERAIRDAINHMTPQGVA